MARPESSRAIDWLEVIWPRPIELERLAWLLRRLAAEAGLLPLVLETRGASGKVRFLVGVRQEQSSPLTRFLTTQLPDTVVRTLAIEPGTVNATKLMRCPVMSAGLVRIRDDRLPLSMADPGAVAYGVLAALAATSRTETLAIQAVLWHGLAPSSVIRPDNSLLGWWRLLSGISPAGQAGSGRRARAERDKAALPSFSLTLRLGVVAVSSARRQQLVMGLLAALRTAAAPGVGFDLKRIAARQFDLGLYRPLWRGLGLSRLSVQELPALLGWPMGDEDKTKFRLPGLPPQHPKLLPLPSSGKPDAATRQRVFAVSNAPASFGQVVGLSTADNLTHLSVTAPTGAGKSTLLQHLAVGDLAAGHGLVLVDPKGDLVEAVLGLVPKERRADVVVLDPTDEVCPVGFNPVAVPAGQSPEVVADGLITVLTGLWPDTGVRTLDVLAAAIATLTKVNAARADAAQPSEWRTATATRPRAAIEQAVTLLDLPRLLTDQAFRSSLVGRVDDEVLAGFWAGFDLQSAAQRGEVIAPVMRRLRQFLSRRSLRAVLGQAEAKFDLSQVFVPSASRMRPMALLVPLNKALLGEQTAQLFGSLVVAHLWQEAMRRAAVPVEARRPVSVILDEAPDLLRLPLALGDALAQARGYGVGFTLAAQFRSQWPVGLREAIDANTLSKICFRQPAADAKAMAASTGGQVEAQDFMALGQYQVYASLARAGHPGPWFSARTSPPARAIVSAQTMRQTSRESYGQPAQTEATRPNEQATSMPPAAGSLGRKRRPS